MSDLQRNYIVPAATVADSRALCAALDEGGSGMFTAELSATGQAPATHFISTGLFPQALVEFLEPGSEEAASTQAAANGLTVSAAQIEALVQTWDVSEGSPWDALSRLGLLMVQPEDV